ncbi:protein phosphatase 2C [Diplocarpon rosae]|nr:protein phosphatase 2C [Diplocarpon rosae]
MFGSSGSPPKEGGVSAPQAETVIPITMDSTNASKSGEESASGEKRSGNGSPPGRQAAETGATVEKKRRSSGVGGKASSLLASAKNSLHFDKSPNSAGFMRNAEVNSQTPLQKLGKQDPALSVPQGQHNNSAGESLPGPKSTFTVGVWEDKNKKCRRTMEDTHAFLYNFLHTPAPALVSETPSTNGCTAVTAVLRWEDRIPNPQSATGSTAIAPATAAEVKAQNDASEKTGDSGIDVSKSPQPNPAVSASRPNSEATHARLRTTATRQRVLYTANVGDARIVLCRNGKALRLSYDHKGSDENEGKRVTNAGGLILNNRVNGVLAVTRALGDSYMKDLVTGHPYTTETVIQPDLDEFIILACDGLWDVCSDQEAVDLIRSQQDPVAAAKQLVDHALARFSTDNLSCMIVRFNKSALLTTTNQPSSAIGVEGDPNSLSGKISETEKIVGDAKRKVQEDGVPGVGVSGSNSGKGHDPQPIAAEEETRKTMEKVVEEEPILIESDDPELNFQGSEAASSETLETLKLPGGAPK